MKPGSYLSIGDHIRVTARSDPMAAFQHLDGKDDTVTKVSIYIYFKIVITR